MFAAQRHEPSRAAQQFAGVHRLLAQLYHVRPADERLPRDLEPVAAAALRLGDQHVEPHPREPCVDGSERHRDALLDVVERVSTRLDLACGRDVDRLQIFLDRPQRLAGPLARRNDDVAQLAARQPSAIRVRGPDVAWRIAMRDRACGDVARRGGESISYRLQRLADRAVIADEPRVILDDPQPFAGAIQVCIDQSMDGVRHHDDPTTPACPLQRACHSHSSPRARRADYGTMSTATAARRRSASPKSNDTRRRAFDAGWDKLSDGTLPVRGSVGPRYNGQQMLSLDTIHQGDSIEKLNDAPEGWVDLVFADPPFNIGYLYHGYDDQKDVAEYVDWSTKWMAAVYRALKPGGSFYLAIGDEFAADLCVAARRHIGFNLRNWIVWHYTFGQQTRKMFAKSHTHILYFTKQKPRRRPDEHHVQRRRGPRPQLPARLLLETRQRAGLALRETRDPVVRRHHHPHRHAQPFPDDPVLERQRRAHVTEVPHRPERDVENGARRAGPKHAGKAIDPAVAPREVFVEVDRVVPRVVALGEVVRRVGEAKVDGVRRQRRERFEAVALNQLRFKHGRVRPRLAGGRDGDRRPRNAGGGQVDDVQPAVRRHAEQVRESLGDRGSVRAWRIGHVAPTRRTSACRTRGRCAFCRRNPWSSSRTQDKTCSRSASWRGGANRGNGTGSRARHDGSAIAPRRPPVARRASPRPKVEISTRPPTPATASRRPPRREDAQDRLGMHPRCESLQS